MDYKFYDTSSLLLKADNLFDTDEKFAISSITLSELEHIKTSAHKDQEVKCAARHLLKELDKGGYDIIVYSPQYDAPLNEMGLEINNDAKILACALHYDSLHPQDVDFVTNDLALKAIARLFFPEDQILSVNDDQADEYTGYKEVCLDEQEMCEFYSNPTTNHFDLYINQYLIIRETKTNEIVDQLCWTGDEYRPLRFKEFYSQQFGKVRPLKGDIYQALAADSLAQNTITMIKGPAGTGKTYLSLGYLFNQLEAGKLDKIIIFCNPVATKNSARLGYYPGTRDEKLLDSQIGNLLTSKLGGRIAVEQMLQREKLILLPLSDIRGYDTSGMRAGIYISEAQNLDITLMKLALQRIGDDSICIIDGDCRTQVDDVSFSGVNNGMRKASKVFRGHDVYGEIELRHIHRSKIAQIAEGI